MKSKLFILIASLLSICLIYQCDTAEEPMDTFPEIAGDSIVTLEGNTNSIINIELKLSKPWNGIAEIRFQTLAGTASAVSDYLAIDTLISIEPGDLLVSIPITIIGERFFETDEFFTIKLTQPKFLIIATPEIKVYLQNDDEDNSLFIPESGYTTPESYSGMELIWQDEFDGESLNLADWTYEFGGNGWGNNELQYYHDKNVSLLNGNMIIEARRESVGGRSFTSSRIITRDKVEFKYGRVDIRAALPIGQGIWPALWMLGANFPEVGWPSCGEIDIMEMIGGQGRENTVHGTAHWQDTPNKADFSGSYKLSSGRFYDEFHVFSIVWTENLITWYVDDKKYHEMSITDSDLSEFRLPFFFIFNIAVGGNWPGSPDDTTFFPQRMIVDYVRVFQPI